MALAHKSAASVNDPYTPHYTSEPETKDVVLITTGQLVQAFRWYTDNISDEKAAEWLKVDLVTAKRFLTLAWCERLISRGFALPEREQASYLTQKAALATYTSNLNMLRLSLPKISIQDSTKAKAMDYLGKIEAQMDKTLHTTEPFNWYELYVQLGIKAAHVPYILTEIKQLRKETETPERFGPVEADLERIRKNASGVRAPRTRKLINPAKIVGGLKYLADHPGFKIKSIDPQKVIGAQSLWVFNTLYKSLTHYVASGASGLSAAGTTVKKFEATKSMTKPCRKPEEALAAILNGTRHKAEKYLDGLTTKGYVPNGRISDVVVLLKVD